MISEIEIARRLPIWTTLSDFYLDTELTDVSIQNIAKIFKESGFTLEEIKQINHEEVAPVLATNLMNTAGDWDGFDEEWLVTEILENMKKRKRWSVLRRLYRRFVENMTEDYWGKVEAIYKVL